MAKVNDLQCIGDALFQNDVKVNGAINQKTIDNDANSKIIEFCKELDCTTVGNTVSLFTVPTGYYAVKGEDPYNPNGPISIFGTYSVASPTLAEFEFSCYYEDSLYTMSNQVVPNNAGGTISGAFSGKIFTAGDVKCKVTTAGTGNSKLYIIGKYLLIPRQL